MVREPPVSGKEPGCVDTISSWPSSSSRSPQFLALPARALAADNPFQRGPDPTSASIQRRPRPVRDLADDGSRLSVTRLRRRHDLLPHLHQPRARSARSRSPPGTPRTQSSMPGSARASPPRASSCSSSTRPRARPSRRPRHRAARRARLPDQRSSVRSRIDGTRLAVMGHSMGGGGTLEASADRPSLQAAIPLTPWDLTRTGPAPRADPASSVPRADTVAPVAIHSKPFYNSLARRPRRPTSSSPAPATSRRTAPTRRSPSTRSPGSRVRRQRRPVRAVPLRCRRRHRGRRRRLSHDLPAHELNDGTRPRGGARPGASPLARPSR